MQNNKFLVTGSSGYIGYTMCKLLAEQGYGVFGIDRKYKANPYVEVFSQGDAADGDTIKRAVDYGISAVFHFAADVDVHESTQKPAMYYQNNVGTTANLLYQLSEQHQWAGHFIFSSTAAVYGDCPSIASEELWINIGDITNSYGRSKLMAEQLLDDVSLTHRMKTTVFRYFNVAGAWNDAGDHFNSTHIVSRLSRAARYNQKFTLYGNDYSTSDGTCVRDYIHVMDVCRAHLHAFNHQKDLRALYNIGTGRGYTNLDMLQAFNNYNETDIRYSYGPRREGDPAFLVANGDRFVDETGFIYKHSCLHEMLTSAWDHYKKGTR